MTKVLLVLVLLVGGFAAFVASRPAHFKISRELTMKAPASAIYDNLVDFHEWAEWSPWEHVDPNLTKTYGGPDRGVGAIYHWKGNSKAGEGTMKITSAGQSQVVLSLDFVEPVEAHNVATFAILPHQPGQTMVTWTMEGDNDFAGKAFGVFVNTDKMVGDDFDRGLESLRIASEGDAKKAAEALLEEQKKQAAAAAAAAAPAPGTNIPAVPPAGTTPPVPPMQAK